MALRFFFFMDLANDQVDQSAFDDDTFFHALAVKQGCNFRVRGNERLNFVIRKVFGNHHFCLDFAEFLVRQPLFIMHK